MSDPQPTTKKKVVVKKIVKKVVKKKVGDSGTEETIVEEIPKDGAAIDENHGEVTETETISEDGKKKVVKKIVKKVVKKSATGETTETTDTPHSTEESGDTPKKKIVVKKVVKKVKMPTESTSDEAKKSPTSPEAKKEEKKVEPKKEEPKKVEPKKEEPKKESPKKEEPSKSEPEKKPPPKEEPKAPKKEEKKEESESKKGGDFTPALSEICYECKKDLGNVAIVKTLGKRWHIHCFVCTECKDELPGDEFHEHNGVPFCDPCFEKKFMSICATCQQPINDAALKALGKKYHKHCFVCFGCKKPFPDGEYGVGDDGNPYCDNC